MADYCDVIKQFNRMCNYYKDCRNCPMCPYGRPEDREKDEAVQNTCRAFAFYSSKVFEYRILEWAAEHPESVYPTWADWFRQIGVAPRTQSCFHEWLLEPIPADIAQKLGIEPKEEKIMCNGDNEAIAMEQEWTMKQTRKKREYQTAYQRWMMGLLEMKDSEIEVDPKEM